MEDTARSGLPICSRNKILPKSKRAHESFLSQNILHDRKRVFCDFSGIDNGKTESVNENENKESKNVDKFKNTLATKTSKYKCKNTKRQEGVECHIVNPLFTSQFGQDS